MARARVPVLPVVIALALLIAGAWWVLRGDQAQTRRREQAEETRRENATPRDSTMDAASVENGAENGSWPDGSDDSEAAAVNPATASIQVKTQLESGRALPGVFFNNSSRNSIVSVTLGNIQDFFPTDSAGVTSISLEQNDSLFAHHPFADLVAVDGGEIVQPDRGRGSSALVKFTGGNASLTFREQDGWAHLRLVDRTSGEPVTEFEEMRVAYLFDPAGERAVIYRWGAQNHLSGWITLPESRLPNDASGSLEATGESLPTDMEVAVRVPGYSEVRTRLADLRGWVEVQADPVDADVVGIIKGGFEFFSAGEDFDVELASEPWIADENEIAMEISATLRPLDEGGVFVETDVQGMPAVGGAFSLYGLDDGQWEMEVTARTVNGGLLRATTRFEKHGNTVDVGTLVLKEGASIEAKLVGAAGKTLPQADLVIVRSDEVPEQGRRLELDGGGLTRVSDLEPGATYRVAALGLPGTLEKLVVAAKKGKVTAVHLAWPERSVECALKFKFRSQVFQGRLPFDESPVSKPRQVWDDNGTLRVRLVPGDYRFAFFAEGPDGEAVKLAGTVTVPSDDTFAATVEMRRDL